MGIAAQTIVELEYDDVGDAIHDAIREVLKQKGIDMVGMTIEIAPTNPHSQWRSIREHVLRIKGSHDVE
jgi:uncharacterized Fe-S cluster-containing protein